MASVCKRWLRQLKAGEKIRSHPSSQPVGACARTCRHFLSRNGTSAGRATLHTTQCLQGGQAQTCPVPHGRYCRTCNAHVHATSQRGAAAGSGSPTDMWPRAWHAMCACLRGRRTGPQQPPRPPLQRGRTSHALTGLDRAASPPLDWAPRHARLPNTAACRAGTSGWGSKLQAGPPTQCIPPPHRLARGRTTPNTADTRGTQGTGRKQPR